MTENVTAGARVRITVEGTVKDSYQEGHLTLADGTSVEYDPARHRTVVLSGGWMPGDIIESQHGRLIRSEDGGYPHWRRVTDNGLFHDDQVNPERVRVVSRMRPQPEPLAEETEQVRRIADFLSRHYDGKRLAELSEPAAAWHLTAAVALIPLIPVE